MEEIDFKKMDEALERSLAQMAYLAKHGPQTKFRKRRYPTALGEIIKTPEQARRFKEELERAIREAREADRLEAERNFQSQHPPA